jgi:hypothetical protein
MDGGPWQPDPSTRRSRCRCSLPGLTGFAGKTVWEDQQGPPRTLSQTGDCSGNRPDSFRGDRVNCHWLRNSLFRGPIDLEKKV